jgi:hypothetical protein
MVRLSKHAGLGVIRWIVLRQAQHEVGFVA